MRLTIQVLSVSTEELVLPCRFYYIFSRLRCNVHSLLLNCYLCRNGGIGKYSCVCITPTMSVSSPRCLFVTTLKPRPILDLHYCKMFFNYFSFKVMKFNELELDRCFSSSSLTLSLPRSSIDDLVFSLFPLNFFKLSYKISLLKNQFVTLFFIRFS